MGAGVNVLYVESGSGYGGSAQSLYHLLRSVSRDRVQAFLFSYSDSPLIDKIRSLGVTTWVRDLSGTKDRERRKIRSSFPAYLDRVIDLVLRDLPTAVLLVWRILRYRIGLVHLNNDLDSHHAGLLAGFLTGRRVVLQLRGLRPWTRSERFLRHFVHHWVTLSQVVKNQLIQEGVSEGHISVVCGTVPLPETGNAADQRSRKTFVVANLNRWVVGKGHDDFIEAVSYLTVGVPNVSFMLLNPPEDREAWVEELLGQLEDPVLKGRVRFVPWSDDIFSHLSGCDILVNPSRLQESFGRLLIEAMAAQCVVIATDVGAHSEIVENGVNGVLVPLGKPLELARAISGLMTDLGKYRRLQEEGRRRILGHFKGGESEEKLEAIYALLTPCPRNGARP